MSAPKRRRIEPTPDGCGEGTSMVTLIHRREDDIRRSYEDIHDSLDEFGDVVVTAHGEHSAEEFPCVSAILASASRPLRAMLLGPLCATTAPPPDSVAMDGDARRRLHLSCTEPEHFKKLRRYIHGKEIPLEVDEAFQMHRVADFYEVLGLRDACCRFLLNALKPHNCCYLLQRADEVHCEPLVQRCMDMLTLDFIAVVEQDREFPALSPSVLHALLLRDELVCAEEFEVFEAIAIWYKRARTPEKYESLRELLALVRWSLIPEAKREEIFKQTMHLVPPRLPSASASTKSNARPPVAAAHQPSASSSATGGDEGRAEGAAASSPAHAAAADRPAEGAAEGSLHAPIEPTTHDADALVAESENEDHSVPLTAESENDIEVEVDNLDAGSESEDYATGESAAPAASRADARAQGPKDGGALPVVEDVENEMTARVRELFPLPPTLGAASHPIDIEPETAHTRQYFWGRLTSRNPPSAGTQPPPNPENDEPRVWDLVSTKEYMVGRSRKSDIRIGHTAPMPYISSQHFRIYHTICWPDPIAGGFSDEEEHHAPVLQAWLEDLSQNGTFINGTLVGKNKSIPLSHGDRIEMVFPQGRQPVQQASNGFSIFTYEEWSMIDRGATETQDAEMNDTQQPTGQEQEPLGQEINNDTLVNTQH